MKMCYLKSILMTLNLLILVVPVIHGGDVEDINRMVKTKVSTVFDLLGDKEIEKKDRNEKIIFELNEIVDFRLISRLCIDKK